MSIREELLAALDGYSKDDFVEVDTFEDIVGDAYFESRNWTTRIFGETNDPGNDANATRHFYHIWRGEQPGFDLLRHEYELASRAIVVIESVPIIHITIWLTGDDMEKNKGATSRANELAAWLLGQEVSFKEVQDGLLSTNADLDEDAIKRWQDRIDARVDEDRLQFIVYKRDPMVSPAPRNLTVWFDPEFRASPPTRSRP